MAALDRAPETSAPRPVDERAERAAAQLGVEATEVEHLPFDLSVLEAGGIWVNVDASGFGLLDRRLDWRALGITLPRQGDFAFRPPRHGLVPDRHRLPLLRPADRAHAALQRYSYHFRVVESIFEPPQYRWVPWQAWPEFEWRFEAERASLADALQAYADDHAVIRQQARDTFGRLAADSARRLEATGQPAPASFEDALPATSTSQCTGRWR